MHSEKTPSSESLSSARAAFLRACVRLPRALCALSLRWPRSVLLCAAALSLVAAFGLWHLRAMLTIDDMPASAEFPSLEAAARVKARFEPGSSLLASVAPGAGREVFRASDVCVLKTFLDAELLRNPDLLAVNAPWSAVRYASRGETLRPLPRPILPDPCALTPDVPWNLGPLRESVWNDLLVSGRQERFLIAVQLAEGTRPTRFGRQDPFLTANLKSRLEAVAAPLDVSLAFTGTGMFRWHLFEALRQDALFNAIAIFGCALLFKLLYGSWRGACVVGANLGLLGLWIFGLMGLAGVELDLLSNGILVILGLAALQDFLFVAHARLAHPETPWQTTFLEYAAPSFLTTLTTIMGFAALMVSPYRPLFDFGLWGAIGAALEWGVTFLVLPAALTVWPKLTRWADAKRAFRLTLFENVGRWTPPRTFTLVLLAALVVSPFLAARIELLDRPHGYLSSTHPFNRGIADLKAAFGWDSRLFLWFGPEVAPARQADILARVDATGLVAKWETGRDVVADVTREVPLRWRPLVEREVDASRAARRYFGSDGRDEVARLYVKDTGLDTLRTLKGVVDTACPARECALADTLVSFLEVSDTLLSTLFRSFALSMLLVVATVVAVARYTRTRGVWKLIVTSVWAPCVMFGVCGALGIPINFVTGVFASVLVGTTGDNALQYMLGGVDEKSGGTVQIFVVSCGLGLTFLLSSLAAAKMLGVLFLAGFMALLVGDLFLLRGLGGLSASKPPHPPRGHDPCGDPSPRA